MSPCAQSRNDTPAADAPGATRHRCHSLGEGGGVKGRSRRQPVRAAQPLRPLSLPSRMNMPFDRPNPLSSVAAVSAWRRNRGERVEIKINDGL